MHNLNLYWTKFKTKFLLRKPKFLLRDCLLNWRGCFCESLTSIRFQVTTDKGEKDSPFSVEHWPNKDTVQLWLTSGLKNCLNFRLTKIVSFIRFRKKKEKQIVASVKQAFFVPIVMIKRYIGDVHKWRHAILENFWLPSSHRHAFYH